jgi:hypothetical protein
LGASGVGGLKGLLLARLDEVLDGANGLGSEVAGLVDVGLRRGLALLVELLLRVVGRRLGLLGAGCDDTLGLVEDMSGKVAAVVDKVAARLLVRSHPRNDRDGSAQSLLGVAGSLGVLGVFGRLLRLFWKELLNEELHDVAGTTHAGRGGGCSARTPERQRRASGPR